MIYCDNYDDISVWSGHSGHSEEGTQPCVQFNERQVNFRCRLSSVSSILMRNDNSDSIYTVASNADWLNTRYVMY